MDNKVVQIKNNRVRKSNILIQKSKFELSAQAQKAILYLVAQIKTSDDELQPFQFQIEEFCQACGIDLDNGKNYRNLKNTLKSIADKYSLWVPINGEERLIRWVEEVSINQRSGTIRIKLNRELSEHLLHLSKNFTVYELSRVLAFKSKYSIRGYELICSVHYHPEETHVHIFTVDDLRDRLGVDTDAKSYLLFKNFKNRILNPVISEINDVSEKIITVSEIKQGRTVVALEFTISTKPEFLQTDKEIKMYSQKTMYRKSCKKNRRSSGIAFSSTVDSLLDIKKIQTHLIPSGEEPEPFKKLYKHSSDSTGKQSL